MLKLHEMNTNFTVIDEHELLKVFVYFVLA